jgi:hypothetical protein
LDGVTIPDSHRRRAAAFLTGEIDAVEYRAEVLRLALEGTGSRHLHARLRDVVLAKARLLYAA